jgi:formylmethanofuran dehydrogenase subunit E
MKQSDYFQGLLQRQKDNVKIYRNSECAGCGLKYVGELKIKNDKIICEKCFRNNLKKI